MVEHVHPVGCALSQQVNISAVKLAHNAMTIQAKCEIFTALLKGGRAAELDRTQDQTGSGEETENGRNIKTIVSKSVSLYLGLISVRLFFAVKS